MGSGGLELGTARRFPRLLRLGEIPHFGVYYSRRQGEATERELDLLPELSGDATVVEFLPWGGSSTVALRRRLPQNALLQIVELSEHNLTFIRERLNQEELGHLSLEFSTMPGPHVPLPDHHADVVVFLQSLEHMRDRRLYSRRRGAYSNLTVCLL